jgi:hypothetical protein
MGLDLSFAAVGLPFGLDSSSIPKSRGINECAGKQPSRGRSIRISLKRRGLRWTDAVFKICCRAAFGEPG